MNAHFGTDQNAPSPDGLSWWLERVVDVQKGHQLSHQRISNVEDVSALPVVSPSLHRNVNRDCAPGPLPEHTSQPLLHVRQVWRVDAPDRLLRRQLRGKSCNLSTRPLLTTAADLTACAALNSFC